MRIEIFFSLTLAMALSLNCYLLGDDLNQMFTVNASETDNVGVLKKPELKNIVARNLYLWKVDMPISNFKVGKRIYSKLTWLKEILCRLSRNYLKSFRTLLMRMFTSLSKAHLPSTRVSFLTVLTVGRPWSSVTRRRYRTGDRGAEEKP